MEDLFGFAINVAMGFFAMANPLGSTPIFYSFVESYDSSTRKKIALRAVLISFVVITAFTLLGKVIFKVFGITLPAFQIAGGIISFFIGYQRLHGRRSFLHSMTDSEKQDYSEAEDLSTYPLAIPMLSGPGTIATAMSFAGEKTSFVYTLVVVLMYAIMCVLIFFSWVNSERLAKIITPGIMRVITRIMGLIVAVIAVQLVIYGIKNVIEIYSKVYFS